MSFIQDMLSNSIEELKKVSVTQKRCKECGEYFTPKSMRQQYCTKLHYRPCPVCGKPVEAKYLSDPPRCCSKECQAVSRSNKHVQQKQEVVKAVEKQEELVVSSSTIKMTSVQLLALHLLGSANKSIESLDLTTKEDEIRKKFDVRMYIDIPTCGFEPGHEYALVISKPKGYHVYEVRAIYDFDSGEVVDIMVPCSSQISIRHTFSS